MHDFENQDERFRELQAELQELKERIFARVEEAKRTCSQDARKRAVRPNARRWLARSPERPPLR
jgi:hypothetical protein